MGTLVSRLEVGDGIVNSTWHVERPARRRYGGVGRHAF